MPTKPKVVLLWETQIGLTEEGTDTMSSTQVAGMAGKTVFAGVDGTVALDLNI